MLYFTLFDAFFSATPGETFAGLRVVDGHGEYFFRHSGIALEVVTTAEAVTTAAQAMRPDSGVFLVVDCITMAAALARAASIVAQTAVPIHICHPRQDFVDDLKPSAGPLLSRLGGSAHRGKMKSHQEGSGSSANCANRADLATTWRALPMRSLSV